MSLPVAIRQDGEDVLVFVRAKPRARVSRVVGRFADEERGEIEIALNAPPVEGAANEELVRFLAKVLGVARGLITVERGHTSRHKMVRVRGTCLGTVVAALEI